MTIAEFMKQLNKILYSGDISGDTEVLLTTLDTEHGIGAIEVQALSGKNVLTIHTDEVDA